MECLPLFIFFSALIFSSTFLNFSMAADTLAPNQSPTDGQTLVSLGQKFELGFFYPGSSKNRYLGIWYRTIPDTVLWIANRNEPLVDSQGNLRISSNGTLVLISGNQSIIWSSKLSEVAAHPVAQLLDTGNLVIVDQARKSSDQYIWQSFDYPCDTRFPGMRLEDNLGTAADRYLTSWKSADDPSPGDFSYRIENHGLPQLVIMMGSVKKHRSGPWNGVRFSGLPAFTNPAFKPILNFDGNQLISTYDPYSDAVMSRLTLNESGLLQRFVTNEKNTEWSLMYTVPNEQCDIYGQCGPNGICRINKSPICECLMGFTPKSQQQWLMLDWSSGCVRSVPLDCQRGEGFVKRAGVKLPDLLQSVVNTSTSLNECETECLKNCSCTAYANAYITGGSGCLMWFGDLIDTREYIAENTEQDVYIRLSASELESIRNSHKMDKAVVKILISAASGMLLLGLLCGFIIIRIRRKRREDLMVIISCSGYMSPEYAIDGKFSVKSDVFSFGVLLIELVSGKKNRGFYHPDHHHNLLGHAWLLWNENRVLELMDEYLKDSCVQLHAQRCIQVGLLCVQKLPEDRPAMSYVLFMLENEEGTLPRPKQPGFFVERSAIETNTALGSEEFGVVTITTLEAR
ncbi:hypothetical protein RJ639_046807 [Escallonia herrerae]|uniref:Receptor-like serine/threonine-protein kinase n=1 Tax=Escallonia herrerae TaxID=1293975 RepID=A0AA88W7I1_9ASTE|nr:hypothetical protein RJ639_046807 [Escallonia herrerae]